MPCSSKERLGEGHHGVGVYDGLLVDPPHPYYRVAFRKEIYRTIDELQADLDAWIAKCNEQRPHQGRWCFGETAVDEIDRRLLGKRLGICGGDP